MTTGIGNTGIADVDARERQWVAAQNDEAERRRLIELGGAVLGCVLAPIRQDGQTVAYAWLQKHAPRADGLPAETVNRAKQAVEAETAARDAVLAKYGEARQYVARHQLSAAAGNTHIELHAAEAVTAHREAAAVTPKALYQLGKLADQAAQIRQVINAAPGKRRQEEERHQAVLLQIDAELQAANLAAQRLGIE